MEFSDLQQGVLERRYKRFLADVTLPTGELVTAHCPNTGAMTGCAAPGSTVWLSKSDNPKRKLAWTLELVKTPDGLICVHSALANKVVGEALQQELPPGLAGFSRLRQEVKYGGGSRADFLLESDTGSTTVEVKAVTLHKGDGLGMFPDAVSERATKHLKELAELTARGERAALVFCVLHTGITRVAAAADIDPAYARALDLAVAAGVEVYALGTKISPAAIAVTRELPVV